MLSGYEYDCKWFELCVCLLFFKRKAAYEMRIGAWSSDVSSSDLEFQMTDIDMAHISDVLSTRRDELYAGAAGRQRPFVSPFDPGPPDVRTLDGRTPDGHIPDGRIPGWRIPGGRGG